MNTVSPAEIAVIIVNYNTADLTLAAIDSIIGHAHGGREVEVHVVDNASPEGDAASLERALEDRGWSERVHLRTEQTNHGFGRGNNLILEQLVARLRGPKYVFLLNPDARLENDAIGVLCDFLDRNPAAVAAGARISNPEGSPVTAAFRFPGIVSTFAAALAFGPVSRMLRNWEVPLPPDTPTQPVGWVAGAAVMFRLSELQRVGFFDPTYFLYFEEVDLMWQLSRHGGEVWHVAEARVMHFEGAATGVKSGRARPRRLPAYWYESWRHYFSKNHGRLGALFAAAAWYLGAIGNGLLGLLRGQATQAPERFYRDFWRVGVRPLLGLRALPHD